MVISELNVKELEYHTIEKIRTLKIRNRFTRLNGKNSRRYEHAYGDEFVVKEIITNKGAKGWGLFEGTFWNVNKASDNYLIGKKVAELFNPTIGTIDIHAMKYDFALHDLAGVILNMPVYRMLGGQGDNPVSCYDGAILMDDISPDSKPGGLGAILDECKADYELGYRAFKLKIGRAPKWMDLKSGVKRDIEVTRLVKENFPDCDIMVDANSVYTPDTIKPYIDGVADCNLVWIEEPFFENMNDFILLREYLDKKSPSTKIADGEDRPDIELLFSLAKAGVLDIMQMDIAGYGLTEWRKIMPRVIEAGVQVSPHNWGYKIKTHYTASFAAGFTNNASVEGVIDETEGVDFSGYKLNNGKMIVPDIAGFGMELIWGLEL